MVHARAGQRDLYAPIVTPLVQGSEPQEVLQALLTRSKSKQAYIADLDGIMRGRAQWPLIHQLVNRFDDIVIWLDAGFNSFENAQAAIQTASENETIQKDPGVGLPKTYSAKDGQIASIVPVLGTETLLECENLSGHSERCILSLDFGPEGFRGDPSWISHPEYWPDRVIVMSLVKVGAGAGPDMERIRDVMLDLKVRSQPKQIFAAGGVTPDHAEQLRQFGVAGALVASALHR